MPNAYQLTACFSAPALKEEISRHAYILIINSTALFLKSIQLPTLYPSSSPWPQKVISKQRDWRDSLCSDIALISGQHTWKSQDSVNPPSTVLAAESHTLPSPSLSFIAHPGSESLPSICSPCTAEGLGGRRHCGELLHVRLPEIDSCPLSGSQSTMEVVNPIGWDQ